MNDHVVRDKFELNFFKSEKSVRCFHSKLLSNCVETKKEVLIFKKFEENDEKLKVKLNSINDNFFTRELAF